MGNFQSGKRNEIMQREPSNILLFDDKEYPSPKCVFHENSIVLHELKIFQW